jgi:hypothetical protein
MGADLKSTGKVQEKMLKQLAKVSRKKEELE